MAAKNQKIEPLTEKQKEDLRATIPLDKAKQFISNLQVLLRSNDILNEYNIQAKAITVKDVSLKIEFKLKETAIDREIEEQEPGQTKIEDFADPDEEED